MLLSRRTSILVRLLPRVASSTVSVRFFGRAGRSPGGFSAPPGAAGAAGGGGASGGGAGDGGSSGSGESGSGGDGNSGRGGRGRGRGATAADRAAAEEAEAAAEAEDAGNSLVVPSPGSGGLPERMPIGENAARPSQLLALPIARRPVFPGFMSPLVINDEALVQALTIVKSTARPYVGLFLVKDSNVDLANDKFTLTNPADVHSIGVLAHIQQLEIGPAGAIAMVMAHRRIRITGVVGENAPPLIVRVDHLSQPPIGDNGGGDEVKATCNEILATLRDIIRVNPIFQQHMAYFARKVDVTNPYALADFAASLTTLDARELQDVLETMPLKERLGKALIMLKKELQLSQLQASIKADVEKRVDKQQRVFFLQEQLKSIKKELGLEKDDKEALIQKFRKRVASLMMPESATTVFEEELEKLSMLERNSSEFNVTRTYLDWITSIPWGKFSTDNFDIAKASAILDEDHYGMTDVKDRILEFIAVGTLRGSVQGKILCLVGPPGVGKTSIGKSIARALNRSFYRVSVGGLSDVAEIKGHRRTYVGAMPGKLIQCLKATGVANPLVLIDEIDKIGVGRGYSGDPSSALLEMLDPNQNNTFMDHYLDTPFDASKVLFICTANSLDTIPGPLLDRMEVIRLAGYDGPEKLEIVKRYLDPKTRAEMGLERVKPTVPKTLSLTDAAVEHLIRWYARESGVRNLEKLIGKIFRKAAMKIVGAREKLRVARAAEVGAAAAADAPVVAAPEPASTTTPSLESPPSPAPPSPPAPTADESAKSAAQTTTTAAPVEPTPVEIVEDIEWTITPENLESYVGKPLFSSDRLYDKPPPGVVMGLAWTQMGGSALYIEVASPYLRSVPASAPAALPATPSAEKTDSRFPSGGSLKLTGKMGDVMQESAQIAYTFARSFVRGLPGNATNDYLDTTPLHMHVPEGATPKDGPSAGVTMTTALLSAALER